MIQLLAISGSLRAASLNSMLLRALIRSAPEDIHVTQYMGMANLPLFNPDLELSDPPAVADLREQLIHADGVIIASPEYAHGVSGVMKNALDWMVSNESFVDKPVMLLNASPRTTIAKQALRETLITMSARVIDAAYVAVPMLGSKLNEDEIVNDPQISQALLAGLNIFSRNVSSVELSPR